MDTVINRCSLTAWASVVGIVTKNEVSYRPENIYFFYLSLALLLTFFRITRHENCDVHFRAVLVFVV